jgi:O-antigen/teichoic acid export membrane protein
MTQFTVPLAMVMFPKIARSFARAEKSDALRLALIGTAILGSLAALAATLLPELPLRILFFRTPANWAAAPLVPWCAWAMLSFALANVLASDRLARADFRFVPWALGWTALFLGTLAWVKPQFAHLEPLAAYRLVIAIVGGFNLGLLGLIWISCRRPRPATPATT